MECACDCGGTKVTNLRNLVRGYTLSCGCLYRENRAAAAARRHGLATHPLYHTWAAMIGRCESRQDVTYKNYGGRGIQVCEQWHDVTTFITWIEANLGRRPDGMTLDRIDNNGNYEPGNVRWATWRQQAANRGRGESRVCERCGITFQPVVRGHRYCSPSCRIRAAWARQEQQAKMRRQPRPKRWGAYLQDPLF